MSDKQLEEYIKVAEANFDSHLEKGTIEMSNEYYNLLEEKMARLINQNQELKKQVEELDKKLFLTKNELDMREKSIDNKLNQQKEFINYLEDEINEHKNKEPFIVANICSSYDLNDIKLKLLEEILSKYKEIIGVSNENNT